MKRKGGEHFCGNLEKESTLNGEEKMKHGILRIWDRETGLKGVFSKRYMLKNGEIITVMQ